MPLIILMLVAYFITSPGHAEMDRSTEIREKIRTLQVELDGRQNTDMVKYALEALSWSIREGIPGPVTVTLEYNDVVGFPGKTRRTIKAPRVDVEKFLKSLVGENHDNR